MIKLIENVIRTQNKYNEALEELDAKYPDLLVYIKVTDHGLYDSKDNYMEINMRITKRIL